MRTIDRKIGFALLALATALAPGCLQVGDPSPEEKQARDAWAQQIGDDDRAKIMREAATHTEWLEKKRVQWEIQQFKAKYNHAQSKKAATRAATQRSTSAPTTQPL